jgi:hypothetical protein
MPEQEEVLKTNKPDNHTNPKIPSEDWYVDSAYRPQVKEPEVTQEFKDLCAQVLNDNERESNDTDFKPPFKPHYGAKIPDE